MIRRCGAWRAAVAALMLGVSLQGCREEQASVEELFSLRTQGLAALQWGQLEEADRHFQRLVRLAPDDPFGHANLGLTHLRAGRMEEAEASLRRARRLDPGNLQIALILAKLYAHSDRLDEARELLTEVRGEEPADPSLTYALAEIEGMAGDSASLRRREGYLRQVVLASPGSIAARVQHAEGLARSGAADSAIAHLEELRRIPPEPPQDVHALLEEAVAQLRTVGASGAAAVGRLREALELTAPYQASLHALGWVEGPLAGQPVLTFAPDDVATMLALREAAGEDPVRFTDVGGLAGLEGFAADGGGAVTVGDVDGDGQQDVAAGGRLFRMQGVRAEDVTSASGLAAGSGSEAALFGDPDNDGWLDLLTVSEDGKIRLHRNDGSGGFREVTEESGLAGVSGMRRVILADIDHDGDLDLVGVGEGERAVLRNNLDGTFSDAAAAFGLDGPGGSDLAFGDFDSDGRLDLVFAGPDGISLYLNEGAARFRDATGASALGGAAGALSVADIDNDGSLDVAAAGSGGVTIWLGSGDGRFRGVPVPGTAGPAAGQVTLLDYDNDGRVDLLLSGGPLRLLQNQGNGTFRDRTGTLPEEVREAASVAVLDPDRDGDLDLVLVDGAGAVRLLRNDGGNLNRSMRVSLAALRDGSGKNNDFGIGSRVEVRAGEIYQTRVTTAPITYFGLGPHLKADVVRVEWPNGVPQILYLPGSDQDILETEQLKGSCAFLYTWDGTGYRFVTDVMWRSALGMPLGLMGRGSAMAFASAAASREYLRVPGDALRPRDGKYAIKLTEELWETAYLDEVRLVAIDHPDSIDIYVDERFVPPAPVEMRLFHTADPRPPLAATDDRGTDLLPALRALDDVYVSNLVPLRYQGLVEPHDLILQLDPRAGAPGTHLYLRGWIFPTDASINVALSQQTELAPMAPSLEVRGVDGKWRTAIADLGFPSGKDKTMVIDLAGIFPTADRSVRIRTNLQIYWDQAFVARDAEEAEVRVTSLEPVTSDLQYRGFSRTFRRGGRYGPQWFDHAESVQESPWRPIEGAFTRFGDVLPLVREPDDMYVVMAPGDETTLEFDADAAPDLPAGWTRTFLLYTDGWIKDADHNTAYGNSVEPLPFHGIQQYPYAAGEGYPDGEAHRRYREEYNTRIITRR